jgi:hypothetical protein
MSASIKYSEDLIEIRIHGRLTLEEMLTAAQEIAKFEAAAPFAPHRLTDLSEVTTTSITFVDVEALAAQRRAAPMKNPVRSAIVAGNDLQFGLARIFQALNDNPRISIKVFRDMASARAWLGLERDSGAGTRGESTPATPIQKAPGHETTH